MGKVVVDLSMSLDGFTTGPNDSIEQGLGEGGERLHDWIFAGNAEGSPRTSAIGANRGVIDDLFQSTGAMVMGRRWFDFGERPWGDDPPFHMPVFVLTHRARETLYKGETTFTFVTDGIENALRQAQEAAGEKNVAVGGANTAQQFLKAGLLDEIYIHLVPILLGSGRRLFDRLDMNQIELEKIMVIESPDVTHLRFKVIK